MSTDATAGRLIAYVDDLIDRQAWRPLRPAVIGFDRAQPHHQIRGTEVADEAAQFVAGERDLDRAAQRQQSHTVFGGGEPQGVEGLAGSEPVGGGVPGAVKDGIGGGRVVAGAGGKDAGGAEVTFGDGGQRELLRQVGVGDAGPFGALPADPGRRLPLQLLVTGLRLLGVLDQDGELEDLVAVEHAEAGTGLFGHGDQGVEHLGGDRGGADGAPVGVARVQLLEEPHRLGRHVPVLLRPDHRERGVRRPVDVVLPPLGAQGDLGVRLVTQHRKVSDRLPAVGEHHRQVHRDPARVMTGPTNPQPGKRVTERTGQPGGIGEVGQQAGAGMPDDTPPVSGGNDLRT